MPSDLRLCKHTLRGYPSHVGLQHVWLPPFALVSFWHRQHHSHPAGAVRSGLGVSFDTLPGWRGGAVISV